MARDATDLVFGSNSQLRAVAEVYAARGNEQKFARGFREGMDQGDGRRPLRYGYAKYHG